MIEIAKLWHTNHVVHDYAEVSDWYRRIFDARDIFVDEWLDAEKRWASMVTIADLAVDIMQPAPEGADLPLGKFLKRFGSHLHATAYFTDSAPVSVFDALTGNGVRCFGLTGADRDSMAARPMNPVFTHPKDTAGQLEFMPFVEARPGPLGVPGRWTDPRYLPGWTVEPWRTHPLAIQGWRVGVVVADLNRAVDVYHALGGELAGELTTGSSQRQLLRLGANTTVELIHPSTSDSVAGRDLAANGEILHSCVFETSDLASAEAHLVDHGVTIAEHDGDRFSTDPLTCHGAVFEFVSVATD